MRIAVMVESLNTEGCNQTAVHKDVFVVLSEGHGGAHRHALLALNITGAVEHLGRGTK
jgi:hypothetical protein